MRSRPQALRITGRVLTVFFQGEMLLNQIQVIGGNKTGVFVNHVTEGSSAQSTGISPGSQILQVSILRVFVRKYLNSQDLFSFKGKNIS